MSVPLSIKFSFSITYFIASTLSTITPSFFCLFICAFANDSTNPASSKSIFNLGYMFFTSLFVTSELAFVTAGGELGSLIFTPLEFCGTDSSSLISL